jgi:hypothetical protein
MLRTLLVLFPLLGSAVEVQPWLGSVYEFHFLGSYAYSRFNKVQGGVPQLTSPFNVNLAYLGLDLTFAPEWAIDGDLQFADTTQMDFNFRTAALQLRYLWMDDLVGDPISITTGVNARATPTWALHDISCPSRSNVDFEVNCSVGKELEASPSWLFRLWASGIIGQGIAGSPWVAAIAAIETNIREQHKLALFAVGNNGFGRHSHVFVNHFDGYGRVRYKSIDLAVRYGYRLGVWGTIRAEYAHRFLAKAYPSEVNTWAISYLLPFSF